MKENRKKGENHPAAKLKREDVYIIREKYKAGNCSYSDLAKEYQVSKTQISKIINNLNWK